VYSLAALVFESEASRCDQTLSIEEAHRNLGYAPRPIAATLEEAIQMAVDKSSIWPKAVEYQTQS
jgi:hypothetical protein